MTVETPPLADPSDPVAAAAGGLVVDASPLPAPPAPRPDGTRGISARTAVVAVAVLLAVAVAVALFIGAGGGVDEAAGQDDGRAAAASSLVESHPGARRSDPLQDRLDRRTLRMPAA